MPSIKRNHGRSNIENAGIGRWGTFTLRAKTRGGGRCGGECFPRLIDLIRTKAMYKRKNVGIDYIADCNFGVGELFDLKELILVAIMIKIEFCNRHRRASSVKNTALGRYWHRSLLHFNNCRRRKFLGDKRDINSWKHCLRVPRVVPSRTHVAEWWRELTFFATLYDTKIGKCRDVFVHFWQTRWRQGPPQTYYTVFGERVSCGERCYR